MSLPICCPVQTLHWLEEVWGKPRLSHKEFQGRTIYWARHGAEHITGTASVNPHEHMKLDTLNLIEAGGQWDPETAQKRLQPGPLQFSSNMGFRGSRWRRFSGPPERNQGFQTPLERQHSAACVCDLYQNIWAVHQWNCLQAGGWTIPSSVLPTYHQCPATPPGTTNGFTLILVASSTWFLK